MTKLRSPIQNDDPYVKKLVSYIPGEVVAAYIAITGYLTYDIANEVPEYYKTFYLVVFFSLLIIGVFWMYYSVYDKKEQTRGDKKRALFQAAVSFFAFPVWVYAIGNPILKSIICNIDTVVGNECGLYSPELGAILLVLFTLTIPLIDRIVFGTALPSKDEKKTKSNSDTQL